MPQPSSDKVHRTFRKAPDLEVHVKVTEIDGERLLNLREYVVSTKTYGRGLTVPLSTVPELFDGLERVMAAEGM